MPGGLSKSHRAHLMARLLYTRGELSPGCVKRECSGCGVSNWGWQDNGWGVGVLGPLVYFSTTGTQRMRIQTREYGLLIDQIVLSPQTYLNTAPGPAKNATNILGKTQ